MPARHVGRDGGDVVDEPARLRLDQLERLVARAGDDELAVGRERARRAPNRSGRPAPVAARRSRRRRRTGSCRRRRRRRCVPSGDQATPRSVSAVAVCETSSSPVATSQICSSPSSPGRPPATASRVPSGENRIDSIRSARPMSRRTMTRSPRAAAAASSSSVSFTPETAISCPSGDASSALIVAGVAYVGGCSASKCGRGGRASISAPAAIHRRSRSISLGRERRRPACGISASPDSSGVIWASSSLASRSPGVDGDEPAVALGRACRRAT